MFKYLVLAILVVGLLSLIYWASFGDRSRRKKSENLLNTSAGTFDESARAALTELTRIGDPNADDYFRRGNIFQYNILEGNMRGGRGENRNDRRDRHLAVGHIVRDYTDALVGMRGRLGAVGEDRDLNPDFMVHRIEDLNWNLRPFANEDMEIQQMLMGFNDTVTTHAPAVRREIIHERRNRAIAAANTRTEAIDNYFDAATQFTNDAQNVHDSKVNNDLRDTLRRIKNDNINPRDAIDEAREYIESEYGRDPMNRAKVANALRILDKISEGENIGTFNEREDNIFAYTWSRCAHPRNRDNSELMREAVINSLADGIENGNQVCINGRTGRVLNSLVMLDYDTNVASGVMTFEAYKNQIFQETKTIIGQEIERARNSNDAKLRAVGEAYDGDEVEIDETVDIKFKNEIKQEIDRNFEKYDTKLNETEINNLKQECYVYATI